MTPRTILVVVAGALAGLGGLLAWRLKGEHTTRPVLHAAILRDRSESARAGCESVAGLAQEVFTEHGSVGDVTLTFLTTGDAASVNEPVEVAQFALTSSRRALEGRGTQARKREEILQGLATRCNRLAPTLISPIYLGMRRALEHLHGLGCEAPHECRLLVQTDARETVEPAVVGALRGEPVQTPALLLQNRDVVVRLCGTSETTTRERELPRKKKKPRAPVVDPVVVWRALFAEPETVRVEPFCGGERRSP